MIRCTNSKDAEVVDVKFTNVIGRDEIRTYAARHAYALMDYQVDMILDMREVGSSYMVLFPNNTDYVRFTKTE